MIGVTGATGFVGTFTLGRDHWGTAGDLEKVSDDVKRLTGREPLTLREIDLT